MKNRTYAVVLAVVVLIVCGVLFVLLNPKRAFAPTGALSSVFEGTIFSAPSADSAKDVLTPSASGSFEATFIRQATAKKLIAYDGKEFASNFTASGATRNNAASAPKSYALEGQRGAYYVVAAGIIENNPALIDLGLKAYEWGFAQMAADGSFPNERADSPKEAKNDNIHPLSFFLESAARTIILVRSAPIDTSYKERAEALIPKLHIAAKYMASRPSVETFYRDSVDTNMLTTPAAAFHEAGVLAGDTALQARAKELVGRILARQKSTGTFPEKAKQGEGFDSNYQTVSLEYLTRYASQVTDPAWKATVSAAISRGLDRFLQSVRSDGTIDTSKNSRTIACGDFIAGPGPKGKDVDIIPIRLYYFGQFFGTSDTLGPIADRIELAGQGFDHTEQCPDNPTN